MIEAVQNAVEHVGIALDEDVDGHALSCSSNRRREQDFW